MSLYIYQLRVTMRITLFFVSVLLYSPCVLGMMSFSIHDDLNYLYTLYKKPQPAFPLRDCPIDIVNTITRHLPLQDQASLAATCKQFSAISFYAPTLRLPIKPKTTLWDSISFLVANAMTGEQTEQEERLEQEWQPTYITSVYKAIEKRVNDGRLTIGTLDIDYNCAFPEQMGRLYTIMLKSCITGLKFNDDFPTSYPFARFIISNIALTSLSIKTSIIGNATLYDLLIGCTTLKSLELRPGNKATKKIAFNFDFDSHIVNILNSPASTITTLVIGSKRYLHYYAVNQCKVLKMLETNTTLEKIVLKGFVQDCSDDDDPVASIRALIQHNTRLKELDLRFNYWGPDMEKAAAIGTEMRYLISNHPNIKW